MPDSVEPTHETLLRLCAESAPKPWYPRIYAKTSGVDRDSLDIPLNDLRLGGLMQLTDWEAGTGQGYILTDLGREVIQNPALWDQFRASLQAPLVPTSTDEAVSADTIAPTAYQRGEAARTGYYAPETPRVMPILLILNLLAFGVGFIAAVRLEKPLNDFFFYGNAEALHAVGALKASDLLRGEWWRLGTCCFLHFGLLHLSVNMYALYVLGGAESLWGSGRFLLIYLFSALGGSCAAMIVNPGSPKEPIILAGASGALWGLMLSVLAWVLLNRKHLPPHEVAARLRQYGFIMLLNVLISTLPNVSASAHIGGGLIGFLTGTLLHYHRFSVLPRRMGIAMMIALIPVLCLAGLMEVMEKDPQWKQLVEAEEHRTRKIEQPPLEDKIAKEVHPRAEGLFAQETDILDANDREGRVEK